MTIQAFKNIALIMAAGSGTRLSAETPKQYLLLGDKTILERTISIFLDHPKIDAVVAVINPEHLDLYKHHLDNHPKLLPPINGGKRRQDSVHSGLETIAQYNPHNVIVHDAARPFLERKYIDQLIAKLQQHQASCLVDKVKDTIRYIDLDSFRTLDRNNLYSVQTPQAFRYNFILELHQKFQNLNCTDDIALVEHAQMQKEVAFIEAPDFNMKITTEQD